MLLRRTFVAVPAFLALLACGCHSAGPTGTYTNDTGGMTLELKGGGKANLTFLGKSADCTYTSGGSKVTVKCSADAEPMVFTVQADGSLNGPPGGFMPPLHKTK